MASIIFSDIQAYLDAIVKLGATATGTDINASPHKRFWANYNDFMHANLTKVTCNGNPIPIVDPVNKVQSAFYLVLINPKGFCNSPQMPFGGPFITDAGYQVTLADGRVVTGAKINEDIKSWLENGCPES